jgi:hypothetical protein
LDAKHGSVFFAPGRRDDGNQFVHERTFHNHLNLKSVPSAPEKMRYPPPAHVSHRLWTAFALTLETGQVESVRSCIINRGTVSGLNWPREKPCFTRTQAKV